MQGNLFSVPGFELKAKYQWNLLCGTATVAFFSLVLTVALKYNEFTESQDDATIASPQPDLAVRVVIPDKGKPKPAWRSYGYNKYQRQHQGFMGFNGLHIVHDVQEPRPTKLPRVFTREPALLPDTVLSYSDFMDDAQIGIFAPGLSDVYLLPEDNVSPVSMNRELELIHKVNPRIPWHAQVNNKGGYVELLGYVDSAGSFAPFRAIREKSDGISELFLDYSFGADTGRIFLVPAVGDPEAQYFMVIKENPGKYRFAQSLADVLPEWKFRPRIKNSKPVGAFVIVGFDFINFKAFPINRISQPPPSALITRKNYCEPFDPHIPIEDE